MKKIVSYMAVFMVLILIIPLVAIIGNPSVLQDVGGDISKNVDASENSSTVSSQENASGEMNSNSSQEVVSSETVAQKNPMVNATNKIKVFNHKTTAVEEMSINDYIKGVVCAEMPASFEPEAIKAQAVIAHTYALRIMSNEITKPTPELNGAHISTDSAKHQAYMTQDEIKAFYKDNYDLYYKKISDCVDLVIDEVITYNDEPILATFHAISGGKTEDAQNVWGQKVPYLVSIDSPEDTNSDKFLSSYSFSSEEVKGLLSKEYPELDFSMDKASWISVLSRTMSDYVNTISVLNKSISGQDFRRIFSLRSANFTVEYANDVFTIVTKGYGHGVGLSQSGANKMAVEGKKYNEILLHYYPNTNLSKIS